MSRRSPGEGTVFQRKDGRWQASLQVHGVRKVAYGRMEREARRKLRELQRQAAVQGQLPDPGRRAVGDLLDAWLEVADLRPSTLEHHNLMCDTYIRPALGKVRLGKVTPDRIQRFYTSLKSPSVADKVHRMLHRAFGLAVLWGWLPQNPCERVVRPKYQAKRKEVWTPQELRHFLQETEGHWLAPLWAFLVASGCRLGEALGLAWDGVNWDAGAVAIRGTLQRVAGEWALQEPKTKAGERTLPLPPETMRALKRQRAQQAEWRLRSGAKWGNEWGLVFTGKTGQPLHRSTVEHAMKRECERLGLPPASPHTLRHLHASLLLGAGLPLPQVAQRMGHANSQITASTYAHAVRGQDDEAAQTIGRAMAGRL